MKIFLIFFLSLTRVAFAGEPPEMHEYTLSNGMRVTLVPMQSEEVFVGLYAKGGYASLPPEDVVSGRIADHVAWNSGIGDETADQIECKLYNKNIEFSAEIYSFHRAIQSRGPKEEMRLVFQLIHTLFTKPNFTKEAFDKEINRRKNKLLNQPPTWSKTLDRAFLLMNTSNFNPYTTISFDSIQTASLEKSRTFYQKAFSNPEDFNLVIVGSFTKETIKSLISESLEKIPPNSNHFDLPLLPHFPTDNASQTLPIQDRTSSTMRLAFPVSEIVDCRCYRKLLALSHFIETHLNRKIDEQHLPINRLSVNLELPYYPYVDHAWISLQFQGDFEALHTHVPHILQEMHSISDQPFNHEELVAMEQALNKSYNRWQTPQEYWFTTLSNAALFGWDWRDLTQPQKKNLTEEKLHTLCKDLLRLDHYSIIATKPE